MIVWPAPYRDFVIYPTLPGGFAYLIGPPCCALNAELTADSRSRFLVTPGPRRTARLWQIAYMESESQKASAPVFYAANSRRRRP